MGWLPSPQSEALKIRKHAKHFFILNGVLWWKNGTKPPLLVILNQDIRTQIVKDTHNDAGHHGRDPTFQRVCNSDSYWWPNQYMFIATYCCSCHECQMRSTYWNTIPLQPQYVHTILRCFDADSIHMPARSSGWKYVLDIVDNLTRWVEAWALHKLRASAIAEFLFNVMCCFGCIFQLTCDNGTEFKGAVEELTWKYKVPVFQISPYNSQVNGKIKRTQWAYLEVIWKCCKVKQINGLHSLDMLCGQTELWWKRIQGTCLTTCCMGSIHSSCLMLPILLSIFWTGLKSQILLNY